jgi:hypothetical protein
MTGPMPHLERAIRRELGGEWVSPRQLSERLELWSVVSVRHALQFMADRGECERVTRPLYGQVSVNLYRVKQASQPATERGAHGRSGETEQHQ